MKTLCVCVPWALYHIVRSPRHTHPPAPLPIFGLVKKQVCASQPQTEQPNIFSLKVGPITDGQHSSNETNMILYSIYLFIHSFYCCLCASEMIQIDFINMYNHCCTVRMEYSQSFNIRNNIYIQIYHQKWPSPSTHQPIELRFISHLDFVACILRFHIAKCAIIAKLQRDHSQFFKHKIQTNLQEWCLIDEINIRVGHFFHIADSYKHFAWLVCVLSCGRSFHCR